MFSTYKIFPYSPYPQINYGWGSSKEVTFNVDMSQEEVGDSIVYLAGGAFGLDGYEMNDDDMDTASDFKSTLTWHSYSELVLWPWGHCTDCYTPDDEYHHRTELFGQPDLSRGIVQDRGVNRRTPPPPSPDQRLRQKCEAIRN